MAASASDMFVGQHRLVGRSCPHKLQLHQVCTNTILSDCRRQFSQHAFACRSLPCSSDCWWKALSSPPSSLLSYLTQLDESKLYQTLGMDMMSSRFRQALSPVHLGPLASRMLLQAQYEQICWLNASHLVLVSTQRRYPPGDRMQVTGATAVVIAEARLMDP